MAHLCDVCAARPATVRLAVLRNGRRHVIDVCGDGTNNAGRDVTESRDDALKAGITINGLAIINDNSDSIPGPNDDFFQASRLGRVGRLDVVRTRFTGFGDARNACIDATPRERRALRRL